MKLWIYVLLLDDFTRYVGLTTNVQKRYQAHKRKRGSVHTKDKGIVSMEEYFAIEVENIWVARLWEWEYAQKLRVQYGRHMVRGGELTKQKVKEFYKKALIGK